MAIVAVVMAVTFLAYLPGLSGPLLLDDFPQLNGLIKYGGTDPVTLFGNYIMSTSGPSGRPVAMATFIADAVSHGPDIWWWKYGNLMIHLINGLLSFWFTALLFKASAGRRSPDPWVAGIIVAGLWMLHPLHVSTVLYTVQRMTQLSTLFVLAGLVSYVKARLVQDECPARGWLLICCGFFVFFPLAIFSKESAVVYAALCALVEILVFRFRGPVTLQRRLKVFHGALFIGYAAVGVFILANFYTIVIEPYTVRDFTLYERVLTQFRIIVEYLSMLLLPVQRKMGFFHDDMLISSGLFDPSTTALSGVALLALITSAVALRRRQPLYALGILFFFLSHTIESSFLGLELMFEHRNYLGSLGLLIAVVSLGLMAIEYRRQLAVVAAIGLIGFSLLAWQRSLTWSSPTRFYQYAHRAHPDSPRVNLILANLYALSRDFEHARLMLDKARPGAGLELHRLYFDCLQHNRLDPASLARVLLIQDGLIDGHTTSSANSLVGEVIEGRCDAPRQRLADVLDGILTYRSRSQRDKRSIMFTKARLLESMGKVDEAVVQLEAAQELSDFDALPLYSAAYALVRAGRLDSAQRMLTRAFEFERNSRMQREPQAQRVYAELGSAYEFRQQFDQALAVYQEAIESMPRQSMFYVRAANLLFDLQRFGEVADLLADVRSLKLVDRAQYHSSLQNIESKLEGISR